MKKWLTAALALILISSFLLTGTALSVSLPPDLNAESVANSLTVTQCERRC